ncbi:MAG: hypothetical protein F6J92_16700 [Symploca sp. SIO1A3]|nr:hypothetical protein [Symploca sp. SIO1A3]
MKQFAKILIIAVFSLVLFASSAAADVSAVLTKTQGGVSPLVGTWENELGSTMTINSVTDGEVRGNYTTAVSSSGCAQGEFPLVGRASTPSLGFVVSWKNDKADCQSVTAWSGKLQGFGDKAKIVTTWLLTVQTSPSNNWQSTWVNKDIFHKK